MIYYYDIIKRKFYAGVEKFFIEWKLLCEDLRQSVLSCVVQHKVCWDERFVTQSGDAHTLVRAF